mgnify:CR=1 FL=1
MVHAIGKAIAGGSPCETPSALVSLSQHRRSRPTHGGLVEGLVPGLDGRLRDEPLSESRIIRVPSPSQRLVAYRREAERDGEADGNGGVAGDRKEE